MEEDREKLYEQESEPRDQQVIDGQEDVEEQGKKSILSMWFSLPTALEKQVTKRFLTAFLLAFVGILFCIEIKRMEGLAFVALGAYMVWTGISIILDWHSGKVTELLLTCVSIETHVANSRTRVTMITDDVPPEYYIYNLPGGQKDVMPQHIPCLVYVKDTTPDLIIAWMTL